MTMVALVFAGEAIFFLPFILPRVFRPIVLDVFEITNLEIGTAFSAYGFVAMVSYFFGGPLADRFAARNLMSLALVGTAAGGFFMATIPSLFYFTITYAFWGATTILLFWAALIRATREWGSSNVQGKAFGLLDGGRGLSAALISTVGVTVLSHMLPSEVQSAGMEAKKSSLQLVIVSFATFTLMMALLVRLVLPSGKIKSEQRFKADLGHIKAIIKKPQIWLHAAILLCGYTGYKVTDDFSLYAKDVLHFDNVKSAQIGTLAIWLRPVVAIAAGYLADRYLSSKLIMLSFLLLIIGGLGIGSGLLEYSLFLPLLFMILFAGSGAYAMRVLYYSVMEEARIPILLTGTTVGVLSVVGYTPDIFVGPIMGWLLDRAPGAEGHRHVFLALSGVASLGLICSIYFRRIIHRASGP